jgi:hypothetical protein
MKRPETTHPTYIVVKQSLFWPIFWVFLCFPVGLIWLFVRIGSNSKIENGGKVSLKANIIRSAILIIPLLFFLIPPPPKDTKLNTGDNSKPISISSLDLSKIYKDNEANGDSKFKGKTIMIHGKITGITKDFMDNTIISLNGSGILNEVRCTLQKSEEQLATQLRKGKKINLLCIGGGEIMGSPVLNECKITQ